MHWQRTASSIHHSRRRLTCTFAGRQAATGQLATHLPTSADQLVGTGTVPHVEGWVDHSEA